MSSIDSNVTELPFANSSHLRTCMRFLGYGLTSVLGWVPRPLGTILRGVFYRPALGFMEGFPFIHGTGVELLGSDQIGIGNGVRLMRDVCINALGLNSKVVVRANARIARGVDISVTPYGDCSIEIGEFVYINAYTQIHGPGDIKIGNGCLIGSHVAIFANNHIFADPDIKIQDQGLSREGIVIEEDCWLGAGVKVLDGVTIGKGSVIGAGAVVTKDIPPYSVAVGVPAKVISSRRKHGQVLSPDKTLG